LKILTCKLSVALLAIASLSSPHFDANPLMPDSGKVPAFLQG
jgi:hypothetical protein